MNQNKRSKLFIEPEFQISFLKFTGIILLVNSIIYFLSSLYFFHNFTEVGKELGFNPNHIFFDFIRAQEMKMNMIMSVSFLITGAFFLVWGLFISHKIAGPIYRLKRELKKRIENKDEKKEIKFRKGDYFIELAELITKAIDR